MCQGPPAGRAQGAPGCNRRADRLHRAVRSPPERWGAGGQPVRQQRKKSMSTGTVKWFNDAKGFGFITQDDGGEDVFCHHTAISADGFRTLAEGQKVTFDVTKGPKGLQAQNVKPI